MSPKRFAIAHTLAGMAYCVGLFAIGEARQATLPIPPAAYRGPALMHVTFMDDGAVRHACAHPYFERNNQIAGGCQQTGTPGAILPKPCLPIFHGSPYAVALCAAMHDGGEDRADAPTLWVSFQDADLVRRVCAGKAACWDEAAGLIWAENPSVAPWIGELMADLCDHEKGHYLGAKANHSDWVRE